MSTNATITVKFPGRVKTIYLHHDGSPAYAGRLLLRHYNSQEKAEALVELGNLSVLAASPEGPEGHHFNTPIDHFCVAYGRDRGTIGQMASRHSCLRVAMQNHGLQHNYYWDGLAWYANGLELTQGLIHADKYAA